MTENSTTAEMTRAQIDLLLFVGNWLASNAGFSNPEHVRFDALLRAVEKERRDQP